MRTTYHALQSLGLAALLATTSASAAIVTSRAALGGDDTLDWVQLAANTFTAGFTATTQLGMLATVSNPPNPNLWRVTQAGGTGAGCTAGHQFVTNFAVCDAVLLNANNNVAANRISISFGTAIAGGGAQFSDAATYGAFTATLAAYDANDVLLETFSLAGVTNRNADNSAVFLGISRQQADIARLDFSAVGFNRYFGINRVELDRVAAVVAPPASGVVPVPSTLLNVALALPLALWARRRTSGKGTSVRR